MYKPAILISVLVVFISCSAASSKNNSGEKIILKIGHNAAAEDLRTICGEKFIEKIEELTDGKFSGKVYPAGQLGDTREMFEGLSLGSVDIVLEATEILEIYGNLASIGALFFLYRDNDHFVKTWTSDIGDELRLAIEKQTSMYPAGFMNRGPRNITSVKAVRKSADMQGLKIRVPNSPAMISGFEAMGVNPIPMGFTEVFNALERKVIDAQENPYNTSFVGSMHQVAPYIIELDHVYSSAHFIMSSKTFRAYTKETQDAFEESIAYACNFFNEQTLKINQESLDAMRKDPKVEYIRLTDEEKQKLVDKTRKTYDNFPYLKDYIDKIINLQ